MKRSFGFAWYALVVLFLASSVQGQYLRFPQAGDVFRDYSLSTDANWRVTDPAAGNPGAAEFLPNPVLKLTVDDLQNALRAELVVDFWSGHPGTQPRQFRFNSNAWINLPNLATVPAGTSPNCFMQMVNFVADVPLAHLSEGTNTLQGTAGPQVCLNFDWAQWGWYQVLLRVYYDPMTKAHPTGSITSHNSGASFGEDPTVTVSASGGAGVSQVDFFAYFDGYDPDGDGRYKDWQLSYHRPVGIAAWTMNEHMGSDTTAPYSAVWNTSMVPDQPTGGIKFVAHIRDANGYVFVTDEVTNLSLLRPNSSVRLYRSFSVPELFWVRDNKTNQCYFVIPNDHDLGSATSAHLLVRSWNGLQALTTTEVNSWVTPLYGEDHHYRYDNLTMPVSNLFNGLNTFRVRSSETEHHGTEIMWPGPALLVRYSAAIPAVPQVLPAYYNFEGAGNTVADVSGNGNNGQIAPAAARTASGRFGNGVQFFGTNGYVDLDPLEFPGSALTVSMWAYLDGATQSSARLFAKSFSTLQDEGYCVVTLDSTTRVRFRLKTATGSSDLLSAALLTLNAWNHIAVTYDGAFMRIFVGGIEQASMAKTGALVNGVNVPVWLGNNPGQGGRGLTGRIDEVRLYNFAQSGGEITADMNRAIASDVSAPTSPTNLLATPLANGRVQLDWTASTDNVGVAFYRVRRDGIVVATVHTTQYVDPGLSPTTVYSYQVQGVDGAGNESAQSTTVNASPLDTDPPTVPQNVSATALSATVVQLNWSPSTDNVGVSHYRILRGGVPVATNVTASFADSGLTAETAYSYTVIAVDPAGNQSNPSAAANATTLATDSEPPTNPTGLIAAGVSSTRVNLFWSPSTDNALVSHYRILRNNVEQGTSVTSSFVDTSLTALTQYTYKVIAVDTSGNESLASAPASGTTLSAPLVLWLQADSGVVTNSPQVSQWTDRSGQNRHALQANPAFRPTLQPSAVNGHPALRFDGVDDFLSFDLPVNGLGGMTVFLVAANTLDLSGGHPANHAALFWNETAGWGTLFLNPQQSTVHLRFGTTQPGNDIAYTRPASVGSSFTLSTIIKSGTTDALYVNRNLAVSVGGKLATLAGCQAAGNVGRGFNDDTFFGGDIAELLVYPQAISTAERQAIEDYLDAKYQLSPPAPPQIITPPADVTVEEPSPASFGVAVTGSLPLDYQWRRNGINIGGANGSTYVLDPTSHSTDDQAQFDVVVTNHFGSITSVVATLTVTELVPEAPTIQTHPASVTVLEPNPGQFTVVAEGTAPLSYQWRRDGVPIGGATSSAYELNPTSIGADNGAQFDVVVTNNYGSITSMVATLTVTDPGNLPVNGLALWLRADAGTTLAGAAVTEWADQSGNDRHATQVVSGAQPVLATSVVNGQPAVRFDGVADFLAFPLPINGLTGMSIFLVSANTQNQSGAHPANHAALFWNETASWGTMFLSPLQSELNLRFGTTQAGNSIEYNRPVSLGSSFALTTAIKDGTADTLYVNGTQVVSEGGKLPTLAGCRDTGNVGRGFNDDTYFAGDIAEVLVYGRALSESERLAVQQYLDAKYGLVPPTPPEIVQQPTDAAVAEPLDASFSVLANGSLPLAYQWRREGVAIGGATASTYVLSPTSQADHGAHFDVVVSNGHGMVTSQVATLTVLASELSNGLALWLRADGGTVLSGPAVSQWKDQSGNNRHATQPSGASQPTLANSAVNGWPAVRFDGVDDSLSFNLPVNGLTGMSIFLVAANTQAQTGTHPADHAALLWGETAGWGTIFLNPLQSAVNLRFGTTQPGNTIQYARPISAGSGFTLSAGVKDGSTDSLFVNGIRVISQSQKLPAIAGCQDTGNLGRGLNTGTFYAGDIAELLVYTRALSGAERRELEAYLEEKYQMTTPSLPVFLTEGVTNGVAGVEYRYDVIASGSPPPAYSLTQAPAGMVIDSDTGVILWTPTGQQAGSHAIQVTAMNSQGATPHDFVLTVVGCPPDTISRWPLDETQGALRDFLGVNHLRCDSLDCPTSGPGMVGTALVFDPIREHRINVPFNTGMDFAVQDSFSLEVWVRTESLGETAYFGRIERTSMMEYSVGQNVNAQPWFYLRDRNGGIINTLIDTNPAPALGTWRHVVGVRDGATGKAHLYVDGVLVGTRNTTGILNTDFTSPTSGLSLGWLDLDHGYYFKGALDEVSFTGRGLTGADVQNHYQAGLSGTSICATGPSAPQILTPPADTTVTAPAPANFSVGASGTQPLSYQWRRDGTNIPGATAASFTLNPSAAGDSGAQFDVVLTNAYGMVASSVATLTVSSLNLTCAADKTVECGTAWTFDSPVATGGCGSPTISILSSVTNAAPCGLTVTRTWRATDSCDNDVMCAQTVTAIDTLPPTLTCLSNKTVECASSWNFDPPSASDSCGTATISLLMTVTNAGGGGGFTATRTWRATDACSNQATCSQTVTVTDTTPPMISCLSDKTAECGSGWTFDTPAASDMCGTVDVLILTTVTNTSPCGDTLIATRTWQATDAAGNSAQCSQTATVLDTTAPTLSCAPDKTVDCGSSWGFDEPMASDSCGSTTVSILMTATNAGVGGSFTATRTWKATDLCGNEEMCAQTVTVEDGVPPTITCPANKTVECGSPWTFDDPSAMDACGSASVAVLSTTTNAGPCGQTITATRTWRASDEAGNQTDCSQIVIVADSTPPNLSCAADKTVECGASWTFGAPAASDNCGTASIKITSNTTNRVGFCGNTFVATRTWTATDSCNNQALCTQTVTVVDTTVPIITCSADKTIECGAPVTFNGPLALDTCGSVEVATLSTVTNAGAGGTFAVTRTWIATDLCNNSATCTQTVTVSDRTAPTLTCLADKTVECGSGWTFDAPAATDSCSGVSVVVVGTVTNSSSCGQTATRTWRATDQSSNQADCSQTVTVADTTPPLIVCAADKTVDCGHTWDFDPPAVSDACGTAMVTLVGTVTNATDACSFIVTRTWRATDSCANQSATCSQKVTIVPSVPPVLTIQRSGDFVRLSWVDESAEFVLEMKQDLATALWTPSPETPTIEQGQRVITQPASGPSLFYRLHKP